MHWSDILSYADLVIGITILTFVSVAMFCLGYLTARRLPARITGVLAGVVLVGTILFAFFLHGRLILATWLPFSNAIILGNWIPIAGGYLSGTVMAQSRVVAWRRVTLATLVSALAWFTVVFVLSGQAPVSKQAAFRDGFPIQTSKLTCSDCCAAALLRYHGIQATEAEMIPLCLTHHVGTPELGLYRGLKRKVRGTSWDIEIVHNDWQYLERCDNRPVLALVKSDMGEEWPRRTRHWWEFFSRADHAVIIYGVTNNGRVLVGDPASGLRHWLISDCRERWPGWGLRLVQRSPTTSLK